MSSLALSDDFFAASLDEVVAVTAPVCTGIRMPRRRHSPSEGLRDLLGPRSAGARASVPTLLPSSGSRQPRRRRGCVRRRGGDCRRSLVPRGGARPARTLSTGACRASRPLEDDIHQRFVRLVRRVNAAWIWAATPPPHWNYVETFRECLDVGADELAPDRLADPERRFRSGRRGGSREQ
jgi:hypothetical protein